MRFQIHWTRDLTPGAEFVLRIRRDNGVLITEVVGKKRGHAATRKQERSLS